MAKKYNITKKQKKRKRNNKTGLCISCGRRPWSNSITKECISCMQENKLIGKMNGE